MKLLKNEDLRRYQAPARHFQGCRRSLAMISALVLSLLAACGTEKAAEPAPQLPTSGVFARGFRNLPVGFVATPTTVTAPAVDPATGDILGDAPLPAAPVPAAFTGDNEIRGLLAQYGELKARLTLAGIDHAAHEEEILRPVAGALAAERARFDEDTEAARLTLAALEARIQAGALTLGHKVVGNGWQAKFTSGRALWNDKGLLKLAATIPELMAYRAYGKASVTIIPAKEA